MKYFTANINGVLIPGIASGEQAALFSDLDIRAVSLLEYIQSGQKIQDLPANRLTRTLSDLQLTAPIPRPPHDLLCVGKNYMEHIRELQDGLGITPDKPVPHYFGKRATQVTGPNEPIRGHFSLDAGLDYEVELAVVIGKRGNHLSRDQVWDHIFGLTVLNELSSRTLQNRHVQWYRGKSLDGYAVMGPWIVSADDFEKPLRLDLRTEINGELRQSANTEQMIFSVEELVSELSRGITLEPGDIIATGTPSGVGFGFSPPRFLKEGDTVRMEIEGIGVLENRVTDIADKS